MDWAEQEDEWKGHLTAALGEEVEFSAFRSRFVGPPEANSVYFELSIDSTPAIGPLRLHPTPSGVVAVLPPSTDEASKRVWKCAIAQATQGLGSPLSEYKWAAFIADDRRTAFTEPVTVGGLNLSPGEQLYLEADFSGQPAFGSFGLDWSYPMRVDGSASGVRWDTASPQAGEDLYRLCALLSVLLESHWTVKQFPFRSDVPELAEMSVPLSAGYLVDDLAKAHAPGENADRRLIDAPSYLAPPGRAQGKRTSLDHCRPTTAGCR